MSKTIVVNVKFRFVLMFRAKNYLNRPVFHGVIQQITLAQFFFETRCSTHNTEYTNAVMWREQPGKLRLQLP